MRYQRYFYHIQDRMESTTAIKKHMPYIWIVFAAILVCISFLAFRWWSVELWTARKERLDWTVQWEKNAHTWRSEEWSVAAILPMSWEILVSPYGVEERLHQFYKETKYRLLMSYYRLSDTWIRNMLCDLRKKSVDVELIHENFPYESFATETEDKWFLSLQKYLWTCDVPVQSDEKLPVAYSHQKVSLSDGRYLLGTANLTYTSFWKNREYRVIWNDTEILRSLEALHHADWENKALSLNDIHPNLLICPLVCRERTMWLLKNATREVIIAAQYVQDKEMIAELKRLSHLPWFELKVLVSDNQWPWRLNELDADVRVLPQPYLHAKNIAVDDTYMLIGSMNFSTQAIENNREVSIILTDAANIRRFKWQFEKDRQQWRPLSQLKD